MKIGIYGTGYKSTELLYTINCFNLIAKELVNCDSIREQILYNIVFFAETNPKRTVYGDKRVISGLDIDPEEIDYLIVATDAFLDILEYLRNHHPLYSVLKNKIIPYTQIEFSNKNVLKALGELPTKEEYFFSCNEQRRTRVLDNSIVISDRPDDEFYFLMPYGIGDTIYACGFIDEYVKSNKINKKIAIICKNSQEIIPKWFGYDNIIPDSELVTELNKFSISHQIWKLENYIYCHFPKEINGELNDETRIYAWENMLNQYRKLVFRFDCNGISSKPQISLSSSKDAIAKSVVICPHATTIDELPFEFWKEIITKLSCDYEHIYVNSKDERFANLPKTQIIYYNLEDTLYTCLNSAGVIAYRSGICDALAFINTRLLVINPTKYWHETWDVKVANNRKGICNYLINEPNIETAVEIIKLFEEMGVQK